MANKKSCEWVRKWQ